MITVICGFDSRISGSMTPTSSFALVVITSGYVSGAFWALLFAAWVRGMAIYSWGAMAYWFAGAGEQMITRGI